MLTLSQTSGGDIIMISNMTSPDFCTLIRPVCWVKIQSRLFLMFVSLKQQDSLNQRNSETWWWILNENLVFLETR